MVDNAIANLQKQQNLNLETRIKAKNTSYLEAMASK